MKIPVLNALVAAASAAAPYCLPGQPCFPDEPALSNFNASVNGRLIKPIPLGTPCYKDTYNAEACKAVASKIGNFSFRAAQPGTVMFTNLELTDTPENPGCPLPEAPINGSAPEPIDGKCTLGNTAAYVVNVTSVEDVQQAVKFAAEYNLRLRIKNTGHDYAGRSTGEGAFTIWTHYLNDVKFIKGFTPCGYTPPQDVLSAGAGVNVGQLYQAGSDNGVVTVGGFQASVGAAGGYVLGGGAGPFTAKFGLAVDNVVQFDVVTADGEAKTANVCTNPDLFWALRGGGGAFAVVTRAYFKAYPAFTAVNTVFLQTSCNDDDSYSQLIERIVDEQVALRNKGQYGIWASNGAERTVQLLSLEAFDSPSFPAAADALKLFKTALSMDSCNGFHRTGQFTGPASWNDAYKGFVSPIIAAGGPVGINIYDISRILDPQDKLDEAALKKLSKYVLDLPKEVGFIWQNVGGSISGEATAVNPKWRNAFGYIDAPVPGLRNGTVIAIQLKAYHEVQKASDEVFGPYPYYNEEIGVDVSDWQTHYWGANYERLLKIKEQVDPKRVFNCPLCVGSEGGC